jgi:hypothetical protein
MSTLFHLLSFLPKTVDFGAESGTPRHWAGFDD